MTTTMRVRLICSRVELRERWIKRAETLRARVQLYPEKSYKAKVLIAEAAAIEQCISELDIWEEREDE